MRFRLLLAVLVCACSTLSAGEPTNLALLKQEIRTYVDSGEYTKDIEAVVTEAKAWLEQRAAKPFDVAQGKLAIVFDLDETLLSNWPEYLRLDLGSERKALAEWFESAQCPVIEPTRELYMLARKLGVHVIYLTGRPERFRAATERNLQAAGCGEFAEFVAKPNDWKETTGKYKTAERQRLAAARYVIIANIGDQESDLAGGYAEKTFKLPNPFYISK